MLSRNDVERGARARVARAHAQFENSQRAIRSGNPLAAEWDRDRLEARLQVKANLSRSAAEVVARGIKAAEGPAPSRARAVLVAVGPEKIWGATVDFVGAAFLDQGYRASRAVARVAYLDGRPEGSGFLISNALFITNNHVIGSPEQARAMCLEFDYELSATGEPMPVSRFSLDPASCFVTDDQDDLDYTVIAVGPRMAGPKEIVAFGFCPLSGAMDKHALGEIANIVQHPDGRLKEVVLRENRLVARLDTVLHYVADTEPGSSGSPVFNNQWQAIALHHWGGPWRQKTNGHGQPLDAEVNEGIRVSAIVGELRQRLPGLAARPRDLIAGALENARVPVADPHERYSGENGAGAHIDGHGRATWRIPLEISVQLPMLGNGTPSGTAHAFDGAASTSTGEKAIKPSTEYGDRSGYKSTFIGGHAVPLPELSVAQKRDAARNRQAEPGDDPFELKYHHFSVVMNKRRKLALFTACNIDGSQSKNVDRKTGKVTVLRPDDPHLEALEAEGAEASEKWYADERIADEEQTDQSLYDEQDVPGFPDRQSPARIARMLQRGHLVRRMDPAWGTDKQALLADADTFHFANCTPQVGFFNMGTAARLRLPCAGGGQLWRALENHVLRNAVADKLRACCFTGPVLKDSDLPWRGIKIPLKFWKVVVWTQGGQLRSLAMMADQKPVIDALRGLPEAASDAEAFDQLGRVRDFLSTISAVERATGLSFGRAVRDADIRSGEGTRVVRDFEEVALTGMRGRRRRG
jgi:endonuclease G, mitochondrial